MAEIQTAMCALVAMPATTQTRYTALLAGDHWTDLVQQFWSNQHGLMGLALSPQLTVALQAGLATLHSPMCTTSGSMHNPACVVRFLFLFLFRKAQTAGGETAVSARHVGVGKRATDRVQWTFEAYLLRHRAAVG